MDSKRRAAQQPKTGKKPYRSPVLTVYGDVRRLTRGATGAKKDGATGTKACWIAEALYGADSPRVVLVRAWLMLHYDRGEPWALAVVPLYRRFGQDIAAAVHTFPFLGDLFRPIFDDAVRRAAKDYALQARVRLDLPRP